MGGVGAVALALWAGQASAAVARLDVGTQIGTTQTTGTSVSGTKTITAGSNRLLVVTVYAQKSASDVNWSVTTATYGGQALTQAVITPNTTTSRDKIYIGYLKEAGIAAATGSTVNITINAGGNTSGWAVFAQTYSGVDQTTPVNATTNNFNETNTNATATFAAGLAVTAGGASYYAFAFNSASGTRTLPTGYTANWSLATATSPSAFGDDKVNATAGTENPSIAYAAGQRYVLGAMTMNAAAAGATLTVGDGTDPTGNVTVGVNGPIDQFTLQTSSGTPNVTGVTVALTGYAALTAVELHSGTSCASGLLASATPAASVNFAVNLNPTTTAATYVICATPGTVATSTSILADVTGLTYTGATAVTDNDVGNTLTLPASTITIGNGSGDPTGNVTQGSTALLDVFTLQASYGTGSPTALTVAVTGPTLLSGLSVWSASNCTGTSYGSTSTITASTSVTVTGVTAPTSATTYYLCGTLTAAASGSVAAQLSGLTVSGYAVTDSDTSNTLTAGGSPGTAAGTASISAGASCTVLAVTAPYTGDSDANNSLQYRTRTPSGTGAWSGVTNLTHAASPYTFNVTGTVGATYDVEVTYVDPGGVTGTAVQTLTATMGASCQTTPLSLSGTANGCASVSLSAAFAGDSNANGTTRIDRGSDGVTFGTNVCGTSTTPLSGATPRACTDSSGIAANTNYYYRATFTDADGISGGATVDSGLVAVGACSAGITVAAGTMPAAANVTQGSAGTLVGRIQLTGSGSPTVQSVSVSNAATAPLMVAGADVASLALFDVSSATTVFVGSGAWNASTSKYDFTNLYYWGTTNPTILGVVLNVNSGATTTRKFAMSVGTTDVQAISGQTVTQSAAVTGNTFTVIADPMLAGSTASTAPMISIVNPLPGGVVSGSFVVRVRVFLAVGNGGIPKVVAPTLSINNGASYAYTMAANTNYDSLDTGGTVIGRTYEYTVTGAAPGAYTLRARTNANSGAWVSSEPVQVTVAAQGKGDGNLLVRDNSSQLCTDCHQLQTHSSESVGNGYGAWAVNCRDCHSPHGTRNIMLVRESITPPSVNGKQTAKNVGFVKTTGDSGTTGWNTTSNKPTVNASFVNISDNSGPCQVCHTRTGGATPRFRNTGNSDTHYTAAAGTSPCSSCHLHKSGFSPAGGDCTGCHSKPQPASGNAKGLTRQRRAITPEFGRTWSHKRSGGRTVAKEDCCVCHMEGDVTTGNTTGQHMDGFVDLRDPDTGLQIQNVTPPAAGASGAYTQAGTTATASEFVRNLTTATIESFAAAVMINQCLKCHDANGAASPSARVPTGTAQKPFGTTITNGSPWYYGELTAGGVTGGVVNVDAQFATTNASYHPIKGRQNNSYVVNANMQPPWNSLSPNKTNGNTTSWGLLITCWDCHTDSATNVRQNYTITAHGGTVTVRSPVWVSNATAAGNLCRVCHFTSNHYATGSATSGIDSNPQGRMQGGCFLCHGSNLSGYSGSAGAAIRPIAGQDAHGFDAFSINNGTDRMWPTGTAESFKPYGFMRNAGPSGQWKTSGNTWAPKSAPGWTGTSAKCDGTACRSSHGNYTPGGVY